MRREPYKVVSQMHYTEVTYFDADDTEVDRVRWHDDTTYDEREEPLTEAELDMYYPEGSSR